MQTNIEMLNLEQRAIVLFIIAACYSGSARSQTPINYNSDIAWHSLRRVPGITVIREVSSSMKDTTRSINDKESSLNDNTGNEKVLVITYTAMDKITVTLTGYRQYSYACVYLNVSGSLLRNEQVTSTQ